MMPLIFTVALLPEEGGSRRDQEILRYWFGSFNDIITPDNLKLWFTQNDQTDLAIKRRFEGDIKKALKGEYDDWAKTPEGKLALILLLDQMTRHVYRGTANAFNGDSKALQLTLEGIENGDDKKLTRVYRTFFYMPLQHAESTKIQELSVEKYRDISTDAPPTLKQVLDSFYTFALKHKEIVDKFGRFPHRNKLFGRTSRPEEVEFLAKPGSGF